MSSHPMTGGDRGRGSKRVPERPLWTVDDVLQFCEPDYTPANELSYDTDYEYLDRVAVYDKMGFVEYRLRTPDEVFDVCRIPATNARQRDVRTERIPVAHLEPIAQWLSKIRLPLPT